MAGAVVGAEIALGRSYLSGDNLVSALKPALTKLSQRAEELVHLGTWDGHHIIYLDKVEPAARAIRVWSSIGQRVPAASTSLGRALLGADPSRDGLLAGYVRGLPADRVVTEEKLNEAVRAMRATGFASEREENEPGVACVAFALMHGDKPIAAISITSIASRMTDQRIEDLKQLVHETVPPLLPDDVTMFTPSKA